MFLLFVLFGILCGSIGGVLGFALACGWRWRRARRGIE